MKESLLKEHVDDSIEKRKARSLQLELEKRFKNSEKLLVASLDRNVQLERDLICVKRIASKVTKMDHFFQNPD